MQVDNNESRFDFFKGFFFKHLTLSPALFTLHFFLFSSFVLNCYPIQTVQFPAVTICNLNIIRKSFISRFPEANKIMGTFDDFMEGKGPEGGGPTQPGSSGSNSSSGSSSSSTSFGPPDNRKEAMKNSLNVDSSNTEEKIRLSNVSVDAQAYAEDLIVGMLARHNDTELMKGGHHLQELLFRCNWKDFNCKEG